MLRELSKTLRDEIAVSLPKISDYSELCGLLSMGISHRDDPRRYRFSNNTRDSAVLFQYTIDGLGYFCDHDTDEIHRLPPGRAFLAVFPSNTSYWLPRDESWDLFYTLFIGEPVFRLAEQLIHTHGSIFEMPIDSPILSGLAELYRRAVKEELEDEYTISADVYRFFMGLQRLANYPDSEIPEPIALVKRYIEEHFADENLSLAVFAEVSGYSQYHLSRLFKKYTRTSPHEYVIQTRLRRANELIIATDMPIKQIFSQVGFHDYAHFSNTFKKHFGVTPGSVRRRQRRFGSSTMVYPSQCLR